MKKLKKSVKITIAMLTVGGVFIANNIPEEKEILVTASKNFVEASPSKEDNEKSADAWVIANKSKTKTRNENDTPDIAFAGGCHKEPLSVSTRLVG